MKYRSEIDGLRALAVIPVIFFHAGFEIFKGGYVGVDIFFVISGYLITTIIINEMELGKFSLINFYERRARRILPALFFVMLVCIPFAFFILFPSDLKDFSQSLVAVSTFSSNFLFWSESGYFDTAAELKPLLHTWSLSVEEQYYILFPLFLLLTWRLGKKWVLILLAIIFIISLSTSHWAAHNASSANFYLLPTRGWELLLGVFSAFYLQTNKFFRSKNINQIASLLGMSLIVYSIFSYDDKTPFPSLYALVPTVGTVLLILTAVKGTIVHKILSFRIMVGIGLISYSTYLWHLPLFVFSRHVNPTELSSFLLIILSLLSFFMAYISWRFIEKPFRSKVSMNRKNLVLWLSSFFSIFILIGTIGHFNNGYENLKINYQFSDKEKNNYQLIKKAVDYNLYENMFDNGDCQFWVRDVNNIKIDRLESCKDKYKKGIFILGDSHSMNFYNIFSKTNKYPFIIGISQGGLRIHNPNNKDQYENFIKFVDLHSELIGKVIYHQSGSYFIKGKFDEYEPSFVKNKFNDIIYFPINVIAVTNYLNLIINRDIETIWVGPFIEYRRDPKKEVTKLSEINSKTKDVFDRLEEDIKETLKEVGFEDYISFNSLYQVPMNPMINDCFIWRDKDHFSRCGENIISQNDLFLSNIDSLLDF